MLSIISLVELILKIDRTINQVFLIAAMRSRRVLRMEFEVEITRFSFDNKKMELKMVYKENIPKARAVGLEVDDSGFINIDCKQDFRSEDIIYSIIGLI